MPIQTDPLTSEPYIRLPPPLSHIIVTPPRLTDPQTSSIISPASPSLASTDSRDHLTVPAADIAARTAALNDVAVYDWLESPPYPYSAADAASFVRGGFEDCRRIFTTLHSQPDGTNVRAWADGCPFRDIRDTSALAPTSKDGESDVAQAPLVGDVMLSRYTYYEIQPAESNERRVARERNAALEAGGEEVVWGIGFWLSSTHHKKGIMAIVVQTVLSEWAIPRMNLRVLMGSAFVGNAGSVAVMRKCGFKELQTIEKGSVLLAESRGGGKRDIVVLRWERPGISS
ncbi:hypothetical protein BGW36DRAFT_421564 [Talaromyces proteolyticus]|uniref:N-acetyltransferase domain-containing protein n=1 Tax=Talaromyces proteolyticus TaxID=1131652 RepID=A0AAD4L0S9_9EURO|nr:uncharacterized protein BGW36DRAFT_421564 [Talaromyces proteolyticus]KAH8704984.1 hypothetical protein BGW36DRAFT_421564 [Talaromyces proteolyticus]